MLTAQNYNALRYFTINAISLLFHRYFTINAISPLFYYYRYFTITAISKLLTLFHRHFTENKSQMEIQLYFMKILDFKEANK